MKQNFYNSNSSGLDQFQPLQYSDIHQPPEEIIEEKQELLAEEQAANPFEPSPISYFYNADYDNISTLSTTYTIHLTKSATIITNPSEPMRRIYHNHNIFYDGDDNEELFPDEVKRMQQIIERTSIDAITPVLPTEEPDNSLSMGDEHLSTIPETELDKLIKSSVENLVPIPSESKDTSRSDSDCDLPTCDDFSPINVYEEKSVTFSNPLFDSNDDFTSSDDESLSDEDDIECKDSNDSNLDESTLLVTPLSDANEDECFNPRGDIDEIDAFLDMDISTHIEDGYHDSERDIIYLESLLNLSLEVFLDHDPRSLMDELKDLKRFLKIMKTRACFPSSNHPVFDLLLIMESSILIIGPDETFQCQPMKQNFYNSNSSGSDQFQPLQYSDIHQPPKEIIEEKQELLAEEQADNPSEPSPVSYFYNADYDNISTPSTTYTIHLTKSATIITNPSEPTRLKRMQQIIERTSIDAITPVLPTKEPDNSLSMGDEHLSTIPETESDKLIKSSVKNLVPIPSEFEDTSGSDSDCDLPTCDDFSPINVYEEKFMTFSNLLFNSNDDFTSSDDESLSDEDDIECKDSYDSNLDESTLLVTPLSDANEDECFDLRGDIDEIDAFLDMDISTDIEDGYHDSGGDIIYLESLLNLSP
ncbi:hypothetical protein Tco_0121711, partial [Tanacetum coccineum]